VPAEKLPSLLTAAFEFQLKVDAVKGGLQHPQNGRCVARRLLRDCIGLSDYQFVAQCFAP
jgi:hypothetical protein